MSKKSKKNDKKSKMNADAKNKISKKNAKIKKEKKSKTNTFYATREEVRFIEKKILDIFAKSGYDKNKNHIISDARVVTYMPFSGEHASKEILLYMQMTLNMETVLFADNNALYACQIFENGKVKGIRKIAEYKSFSKLIKGKYKTCTKRTTNVVLDSTKYDKWFDGIIKEKSPLFF